MGRIIKFEKTKWPRSVFNPQKLLWPETSTSTLKLPLSPRPNLMPFPSRETASATKYFITQLLYCDILLQYDIKSYIDRYTGLVFRSYCTFILATFCFEKLKQTST